MGVGGGASSPPLYVQGLNGAKFMPFNVHSWPWSNHGYIIAGPCIHGKTMVDHGLTMVLTQRINFNFMSRYFAKYATGTMKYATGIVKTNWP